MRLQKCSAVSSLPQNRTENIQSEAETQQETGAREMGVEVLIPPASLGSVRVRFSARLGISCTVLFSSTMVTAFLFPAPLFAPLPPIADPLAPPPSRPPPPSIPDILAGGGGIWVGSSIWVVWNWQHSFPDGPTPWRKRRFLTAKAVQIVTVQSSGRC